MPSTSWASRSAGLSVSGVTGGGILVIVRMIKNNILSYYSSFIIKCQLFIWQNELISTIVCTYRSLFSMNSLQSTAILTEKEHTGHNLWPKFRAAVVAALLSAWNAYWDVHINNNNNGGNTWNENSSLSNTSSTIQLPHGSGNVHVQSNNWNTQITIETPHSTNTSESGIIQWIQSLEIEDILMIGCLVFVICSGTVGVTYTFTKKRG